MPGPFRGSSGLAYRLPLLSNPCAASYSNLIEGTQLSWGLRVWEEDMARKVWFQLVDERSRRAFMGFRTASVTSDAVNDIEDLRKKIHAEYDHTQPPGTDFLARVVAGQLRIYANRAAYDAMEEPLRSSAALVDLGDDVYGALIVEVPQEPHVLPNEKRQRTEAVDPRQLNELVAIAQKLNGAEVGTVLDTPTIIFGTSIFDGLYIRQEYWDLHDIIKQRLRSNRSLRRILVVGSPGIGKSVFGVFLLLLFMTEHKNVAYRQLADKVVYFTWDSDGYKCSRKPYVGRTYDGLFDGNEAGEALWLSDFDRAFLFASPRTKNYKHFVKTVCFKVYMNPWTKDECQRFADAIHLEGQDEWLRRFNLVGGKPRFLFSSSETFDDLVERVKDEVPHNLDELKDQVRLFQQNVFDDRMKHIVFHLYRDENAPSRAYLAYSSLAVEAIMNACYQVGSADQIRALLQTPAPNLQSWHGKEIEKFMLQELAASTFCMRALEGGGVGTVTRHGPLNAASKVIQASSEIQNKLVLYIPLSNTFPAIDGVLVVPQDGRVIYAQSTVATAHPIKYQQLRNVYQDLTQRQEFQGYTHILLFIASSEIYDGFTVQSYKNADGRNPTARVDIDVTQYVGKIVLQKITI